MDQPKSIQRKKDSACRNRGRPRKEPSQSEQLNTRRERNRVAQSTFRQRQKAVERDRRKEVDELEKTLDHVVSTFSNFAEEVVESPWARQDLGLMETLRQTMNTVRSILVQNSAPASEVPEQRIFINSTENVVDNLQSETSESRPVLHVLNVGSDAKQRSDTPLPSIASAESSESPALASPNNLLHQNFHNSAIKNVFGNGWTNAPSASVPFTKRGILDSPFSLHIALAAIQGAYEALSSTTDIHLPSIQQKFGRVLRHHTREQILFNLRWSLGPGIADLGRLAMASFDQTSSCGSVSSLSLENRIEYGSFERRQDDCNLGSSDEEAEAVCNADDVARWIRQRTTTEIDGDVLELNVKSLEEHTKRRSPEAFKLGLYGYVPGMPNADTFGDYYDGHSKTGVVRISKSLFLQNVIEIGFCLHVGPAFGEKKLGQVVRASMVPCYNDGL